jgi:hypothetical protein
MAIETNSKIDLISKGLILCGEAPLTSLSDNRYGATVGANLFENIYENELQSNRWRFAMNKKALSRLVSAPLNQWAYAYQLPSDMLLPVGVFPPDLSYEIYADHLYSDRTSVELDYMFKPEVTDCPAYFTKLLTYALAKDMIKSITESDDAVQIMTKKYDMQRNVAMFADAQGRPAKPAFHSPFTDVRY